MSTVALSEKVTAFVSTLGVPSNTLQKAAYDELVQLDFPTTKNEYWKYTRVGKIANSTFNITKPGLAQIDKNDLVCPHYLVIENGILREDLSNYSTSNFSVRVYGSGELTASLLQNSAIDHAHLFSALNTSYFQELIEIRIAKNTAPEQPLQLLFISTGDFTISNPRLLIHAHASSTAGIKASFSSKGKETFTNVVAEFFVDENAHLSYDKIQDENSSSFHVSTEQVSQAANSMFKINTITLDGAMVRNNVNISVSGTNCETHLNGVVIAKENQHVDNHTFVDHKVAHCFSSENYKYVLDGKSTGVFNGRVIVRKDAQKINAYQKNANILLSDFAQIYSKPELEIYADDVKCSHGSTTGQLDDNAIFYLQARGISKDKAKKLLVSAFIGEVTDHFTGERQQEKIAAILREKHNWRV
jgi:Fe-S cluster assembly protein SufD